ncbi:MAG TPA: IS481 family transposase, partial [Actinomycetes bacterium]|nr:IS481 family transposase [Actinomycetes bacterium]
GPIRGGKAAFEPRSRRPHSSPTAVPAQTVELIYRLRDELTVAGLDAGPDTITMAGLVVSQPRRRPRPSYVRFAADLPDQTWQADFTHSQSTPP